MSESKCCPNHPERQAVARCETCFKPLCEECCHRDEDHAFCSVECATNYLRNAQMMADLEARDARRKRIERIRQIILLIILLVISWIVYSIILHPPSWAVK
ncbi:MAG: hypothetical protein D6820_17310 [Lentisphaerae bacterium]|nr:MAG: hypothetical protein D6820_17310 [Lentisphaerota bacterium]